RLDVREEHRLAAPDPALGDELRRELRRDRLQPGRAEEAALLRLPAERLQVEVRRREEPAPAHQPRAVADERVPAHLHLGRRGPVLVPGIEDVRGQDLALQLHSAAHYRAGAPAPVRARQTVAAVPSTSVPALMNMPPTPWATLTCRSGTWAA